MTETEPNHQHALEAFPEGFDKTPPKPKGETASFEEFNKDPKNYSLLRGLTPQGLRNHVIMPTTVQINKRDIEKGIYPPGDTIVIDILRKIDFSVYHGAYAL
jgi:hypothetical protein